MALNDKPARSSGFVSSVWSFPSRADAESRPPYRWYGTLPAPLIEQVLDLYASPGATVLDPFSGSGAIGVTAADRGIRATGIDVNPLAVLTSRARAWDPGAIAINASWQKVLAKIEDKRFRSSSLTHLAHAIESERLRYTAKWFDREVLERTWIVIRAIAELDDVATAQWLLTYAAKEVRVVANVDPRCTHHLVTKIKSPVDPVIGISASVVGHTQRARRLVARFEQGDATSMPAIDPHDLVIAHPPYLGVIHYNQIHRLATDLIGLASTVERSPALIGLDWDFVGLKSRDMSTDNSDRYDEFVEKVADRLVAATSPTGRLVVIIGDQRNKGVLRHPFTSYVKEVEARGLVLEENFIWVLQNNGGMHVLRRGNFIDHNYVLVFRRP